MFNARAFGSSIRSLANGVAGVRASDAVDRNIPKERGTNAARNFQIAGPCRRPVRTGAADESGYEHATIDVAYSFEICSGNVTMLYSLRPKALNVGQWYRFGAILHLRA
jgi:hypothetical protein